MRYLRVKTEVISKRESRRGPTPATSNSTIAPITSTGSWWPSAAPRLHAQKPRTIDLRSLLFENPATATRKIAKALRPAPMPDPRPQDAVPPTARGSREMTRDVVQRPKAREGGRGSMCINS